MNLDAPDTLYKRKWSVTGYQAKNTESFFDFLPNGIAIENLRIQFEIEKSTKSSANKCKIDITNLSAGSRAFFAQTPVSVRVDVGYEATGARHLFTGDVQYGESKLKGTDWITTLQLGDGSRALRGARVSKSFKSGVSVLTALRTVADSLGLQLPAAIEASADLQRQFASGVTLQGSAASEMSRLLAPFGYDWSIQDGRLQILRDDQARTDRALVISQETGLLDSPEFGTPSATDRKKGRPRKLKIKTLLYPQVTPGSLLDVRSLLINGIFRAGRVLHKGDSHGSEWSTEIEATPYK